MTENPRQFFTLFLCAFFLSVYGKGRTCMEIVRVEKPCLKIHSASSSSSSSSAGLTGMDRNYKAENRVRKTDNMVRIRM